MIALGITGRSGCGKSTVTAVFSAHGVPLADADQISREILLPGSPLLPKLAQRFGADIHLPHRRPISRSLRRSSSSRQPDVTAGSSKGAGAGSDASCPQAESPQAGGSQSSRISPKIVSGIGSR